MPPVSKPSFSLVIPAYNESTRLPASLQEVQRFLQHSRDHFEVLVVVEESSDQTLKIAQETVNGDPRFHVIDNQVHRGKGYAVKSGMLRATGDVIFFMDADLSTPLTEITHFAGHFREHPETQILIGSRAMAQSQIVRKQTWIRRNMGRTFNRFVQLFGIQGIKDTQCGFKAFRREVAQEIFSRQTLDGFAFDVEVLLLAQHLGYHIDVRPVRWINSPESKVRIWIDPLKMLWDLLRIRLLVHRTLERQPPSAKVA